MNKEYGNSIPNIVNRDEVVQKVTKLLKNQEPMDEISNWLMYNVKLQIDVPEHGFVVQLLLIDALGDITIETSHRTIQIFTDIKGKTQFGEEVVNAINRELLVLEAERLTKEAAADDN